MIEEDGKKKLQTPNLKAHAKIKILPVGPLVARLEAMELTDPLLTETDEW